MNWFSAAKTNGFLILTKFCFLFLLGSVTYGQIPVWIDTDPAIGIKNRDVDDGLALLQAFRSPELEIRGISVVFGNAPLKQGYPIAKNMVKNFGPEGLLVYPGASTKGAGKDTPAYHAIIAALSKATYDKEKLTILALGPATNVAAVVKNRPDLVEHIKEIIAVAGRRPGQRFQTGKKNRRAHRDFNFELDADAFQTLLNTPIPLILAPFEISSKVWIKKQDLQKLEQGDQGIRWAARCAYQWLNLWQEVFAVDGFNPFDTLAVAYLTAPGFIQGEQLPAMIQVLPDDVTEQRMQGTKEREKPYLLVSKKFKTDRQVYYCHTAKPGFKVYLLQRLTSKTKSRKEK